MPLSEAVRALYHINPNCDRHTWVRAGMALHDEYGDEAFDDFDQWSSGGDDYTPSVIRSTWRSFSAGGGVGLGTLIREAQHCGYRRDSSTLEEISNEEREAREHRIAEQRAKDLANRQRAADLALKLWKMAQPLRRVGAHPYLDRKGLRPVATLRELGQSHVANIIGYAPKAVRDNADILLTGRILVAPVKVGQRITTCELIDESGAKSCLRDGLARGGYWSASELPEGDGTGKTVLVAEGIGSALAAHQETGYLGIAARYVANLPAVATAFRARYPTAEIIVLGELEKVKEPAHA
jgi:putative DNA primase/helicase